MGNNCYLIISCRLQSPNLFQKESSLSCLSCRYLLIPRYCLCSVPTFPIIKTTIYNIVVIYQDSAKKPHKSSEEGIGSSNAPSSGIPRNSSSQLLAQRKLFAESSVGRASFQKLLEPSQPQKPGIAPYRVVLGNVKDKVVNLLLVGILGSIYKLVC